MGSNYTAIDGAGLLTGEQARKTVPEARETWANAARRILQQPEDQIARLPLEQRLSLYAATYHFPWQRVRSPDTETRDWDRLRGIVRQAGEVVHAELTDDFLLQQKALRQVPLPQGYFDFVEDIHRTAYDTFSRTAIAREVLPKWGACAARNFLNPSDGTYADHIGSDGRKRITGLESTSQGRHILTRDARALLDAAGVTHEKTIALMNVAAQAMHKAWTEKAASVGLSLSTTNPMRVIGFDWHGSSDSVRQQECGVQYDTQGTFYMVGDHCSILLDPRGAGHVAFHEPQHDIQKHLVALGATSALNTDQANQYGLADAARLFALPQEFGIRMLPSSIFSANAWLRALDYANYCMRPNEVPAFYQGNLAARDINAGFMPDIAASGKFAPELPPFCRRTTARRTAAQCQPGNS